MSTERAGFESVSTQEAQNRLLEAGFRPGVPVVLKKTEIIPGKTSSVPVGSALTGTLVTFIENGKPIHIRGKDASGSTSEIRGIHMEGGKYYLSTDTSRYEIQINPERIRSGLTLASLSLDLGGLTDLSGHGIDGTKLYDQTQGRWDQVFATYGMKIGDVVEFFAERPRKGTLIIGRVPGKEHVAEIMDEKGNPWSVVPIINSTGGYIRKL